MSNDLWRKRLTILTAGLALATVPLLSGCDDDVDSVEDVGEEIDDAMDDAADSIEDAADDLEDSVDNHP